MKLSSQSILILFSGWILIFVAVNLSAQSDQSYRFTNYSNKDGFNQNTIKTIEQDRAGFLWLGTSNGLIRYDGYSFENISWQSKHLNDVYHGPILDICNDSRGLLWIVSSSGLKLYSQDQDRFIKVTSDSLKILTKSIEDRDGSMWMLGNAYISKVTVEMMEDTVLLDWTDNLWDEKNLGNFISDLVQIDQDLYLIATDIGVYFMSIDEGSDQVTFEYKESILPTSVNCLTLQHNIIWIGTNDGLYKTVLNGSRLHVIDRYLHAESNPATIPNDHIADILVDSQDRLWVGTWHGGLALFNEEKGTFTNYVHDPRKKAVLSGNMVNCLYEDQFKVLWIGTAQAGLSKLDLNQKKFMYFEHDPYNPESIPGNLINSVIEDHEGYLWISTYFEPLSKSTQPVSEENISAMTFERFENWFSTFPDKNILSIYEDKYGFMWFGYANANVVVYNKKDRSFTQLEFHLDDISLPVRNIRQIAEIENDKVLLAGSRLIVLEDPWRYLGAGNAVTIPVLSSYSFDNQRETVSLQVVDSSKFWVGFMNNGLSKFSFENKTLQLTEEYQYNENNDYSISNNAVFAIKKDEENDFWVGTFGGGLNRANYNDETDMLLFEQLHDTIGLLDNAIYGIIRENDSTLWYGQDLGITVLNTRTLKSNTYNMYDGLPNNNYRRNAFFKGASGFFYFGGLNGLTVFNPEEIKPNTTPPEVSITNLLINNKPVTVGEPTEDRIILDRQISELNELTLNKGDRTVSLEIITMHTAVPEKNRLSYILEGFDKEWINIDQGYYTATYTNLKPGDYTFRVRGYNCDGVVSAKESSLQVTMLAPWYASPIARLLFVFLILSAIIGISFYLVKLKSLQNELYYEHLDKERIKELNQSKLQFFTNISHEFKTPLSLISVPLQKLREIIRGEEERAYVEMIANNSNRLIRLMDQLLTFRKIEAGGQQLTVSRTSMEGFFFPVADAFESLSMKKGIHFYYRIKDPSLKLHIDLEKMEQVLFNLLSNAFKFTPPNGTVRLEGGAREINGRKYACFDVTDNGSGIHAKDIEKIFDRFYQSPSELMNLGAGIGLSFSKSIVELHKGYIHVESVPGKKTTFSVRLPMDELVRIDKKYNDIKRLNADELLEYEDIARNTDQVHLKVDRRKHTLLIVDDESEFRQIISNVFRHNYCLLEASNGNDALDLATNEEVDLIISDVMMPGLDGYQFCRKVKTDMQLCHIPVLLLTALEEIDNHIQGIEEGADAYIAKPFNLKYLEVTVHKLLENREKLKLHFTQSSSVPENLYISGIDAEFIKKLNDAISKNLDNSSFGVEELAGEVCLSTTHLYRKVKLLTGQIPNSYLRNYRLQYAADMISSNPGISVKNVMYEVGIESASHFSHAFKKKFGCSPSEFMKRKVS